MDLQEKIKRTNERLDSYPIDKLQALAAKHNADAQRDFEKLKSSLNNGKCSFCNRDISSFNKEVPCFHWLLWESDRLRKKHFPYLFEKKGFYKTATYLRWVANSEAPFVNINDLVEEGRSVNFIDLTIKYKNLEWSFICSENDRRGHEGRHKGLSPHYHFQMKKNGYVVINYNSFHLPFIDYDEFSFAMAQGKFSKLRISDGNAAGAQTVLDRVPPKELVDNMIYTDSEKEALFMTDIFIKAEGGKTISGDDIADLLEERKRTNVPFAKLVEKLKNVKVTMSISPGPGIPEKSQRNPNRGNKLEKK